MEINFFEGLWDDFDILFAYIGGEVSVARVAARHPELAGERVGAGLRTRANRRDLRIGQQRKIPGEGMRDAAGGDDSPADGTVRLKLAHLVLLDRWPAGLLGQASAAARHSRGRTGLRPGQRCAYPCLPGEHAARSWARSRAQAPHDLSRDRSAAAAALPR